MDDDKELRDYLEKKLAQKAGIPVPQTPEPPPWAPKPDYTNSIVFIVCTLIILGVIYFVYSVLSDQIDASRRATRITMMDVPTTAKKQMIIVRGTVTLSVEPNSCFVWFPGDVVKAYQRETSKGHQLILTQLEAIPHEIAFYSWPVSAKKCPN